MLPASLRKQKWWPRRLKSSVLRMFAHFSPIPLQAFPQMVCFLLWGKKKTGNRWRAVADSPLTHAENFTRSVHKTDLRITRLLQLHASTKRYQSVRMMQGVDCILFTRTAYSSNKQHWTSTWSTSTFKRVQFIKNRFVMSLYLIHNEFTPLNSCNHVGMA